LNKTIEILIAPDGTSQIETKGFVGSECQQASRFVEQALGEQTNEALKSEFHQAATVEQSMRQTR
jgi:hypothetical protein